ncbi:MAG: hypothetical protein QOC81_2022 [Thermoanaerobaculia bacterium]|nr:hypothetical protein [Thermoanaerobaculia bacterium]
MAAPKNLDPRAGINQNHLRLPVDPVVSTRVGDGVVRASRSFIGRCARRLNELEIPVISDNKQTAHAIGNRLEPISMGSVKFVCHVANIPAFAVHKPNGYLALPGQVIERAAYSQRLKKLVGVRWLG